ncbi:MAG: hypothetical protein M0P71_13755 [Melioribacteraceae bacterium]|nr:hypothetical protein [Melioribacteraceae bacterium]
MLRTTYERFDIVSILTTKGIKWMSDLPGKYPDPNGPWTIVCTFPESGSVLIQKNTTLAKIPASDIIKIANYGLDNVFKKIQELKGI